MLLFPLRCKPYVEHFLTRSFGSPALIRNDSEIGKYFFQLLEDPRDRRENEVNMNLYTETVHIKITQDVVLRNGCILTKTNLRDFNFFVEEHFKNKMRVMIDTLLEFQSLEIKQAIHLVYEKFEMNEDFFPYETIKKDYYRYRKRSEALITKQ